MTMVAIYFALYLPIYIFHTCTGMGMTPDAGADGICRRGKSWKSCRLHHKKQHKYGSFLGRKEHWVKHPQVISIFEAGIPTMAKWELFSMGYDIPDHTSQKDK